MNCQKIVNVLAVASATVSLAVVGTVGYLYINRTAIIEDIKEKAMESIMGGGLGGSLGGDLPIGTPDLAPPAGQAAVPDFAGENAAAGGTSSFKF